MDKKQCKDAVKLLRSEFDLGDHFALSTCRIGDKWSIELLVQAERRMVTDPIDWAVVKRSYSIDKMRALLDILCMP